MKSRGIILSFLFQACCICLGAQNLATLPPAPQIESGTLPCGLEYRIVASSRDKGYASAALVQSVSSQSDISRSALVELEHCSPLSFLRSRGVAPSAAGYIQYKSDARVFRFDDIPFDNQAARDSALLILTDLARLSGGPQTLILCGDFDKAALMRTLSVFSLTLPSIEKASAPSGGLEHTPVPLVRELMLREFDFILRERLSRAMASRAIPYSTSAQRYPFDMVTDASLQEQADSVLAGVLEELRLSGADSLEHARAKAVCLPGMLEDLTISDDFTRREYLDRLIDDVVEGTVTTSYSSARTFFYRRSLKPARELELFNRFVGVLVPEQGVPGIMPKQDTFFPLDTLIARIPQTRGVKVVSTAKEPVSGGAQWVLSNGMKVIYCKRPTPYRFRYCLIFKGGLSSRSDLLPGQSAYFSELFDMFGAGGATASQLRSALEAEGIGREVEVGLNYMTISGEARSSRLAQTLSSLALLSVDRTFDSTAYAAFRSNELVRESLQRNPDINERLDSAICPSYLYTGMKSAAALTDDLPQKAAGFFDWAMGSWRDAVLIIYGDVAEDKLRKAVGQAFAHVPAFHRARIRRSVVPYTMLSGRNRVYGHSEQQRLDFALTAEMPLSQQNYFAGRIALMAVRDALSAPLLSSGLSMECSLREFAAPKEMMRMYLSFRPVEPSALPEGIAPSEGFALFVPVIEALKNLPPSSVAPDALARYKASLKASIAAELSDPEQLSRYIVYRYVDNKDLTGNYQKYIDQIGEAEVIAAIKAFTTGPRSSYRIISNEQEQ